MWAHQGVLLLNTAFTTEENVTEAHIRLWNPYIIKLITRICSQSVSGITFFLWGNKAKDMIKHLGSHMIMTWSHPSPMADNRLADGLKFKNCDHFAKYNADAADPINWDLQAVVYAFTDGAASLKNKTASYSAVLAGGMFKKSYIIGKVLPHEYVIDGDMILSNQYTVAELTNNRGELLGMITALHVLYLVNARNPIILVYDSEYAFNSLTKWYPARLSKGTESELKNLDLIQIGYWLLEKVTKLASSVTFVHQPSHQKSPMDDTSDSMIYWKGNKRADELASSITSMPDTIIVNNMPYKITSKY
jgi:ribonuclease HI